MATKEAPEEYLEEIRSDLHEVLATKPGNAAGLLVFHYTSAEAFRGIIENREIWLSNAAYLNDPSELTYAVEIAHEVLPPHVAS